MTQQSTPPKPDYVLGTHDEELARLGRQHSLWREFVLDVWQRAGIAAGHRVLDVGAGPGFATMDLAEIVGPAGHVTAVEISPKYVHSLKERAEARGLTNVTAHVVDLMQENIPLAHGPCDFAWCRWVAMFVPDVAALVQRIHAALRSGGTAIFHEYLRYDTYGLQPPDAAIASFLQETMKSFRDRGGEPNISGKLLTELRGLGFEIISARPIARSARPHEPLWQWPAGFIRTHVPRLRELGQVDDAWCAAVMRALEAAEKDPQSIIVTPTVLEITARK